MHLLQKLVKRFTCVIGMVIVSCSICACVCIPYCTDADSYSPVDLITLHEYVCIAEVDRVDTVASLGNLTYFDNERLVVVLEYALTPRVLLKGEFGGKQLRLWYVAQQRIKDGYWSVPLMQAGELTLVYGNRVVGGDSLVYLIEPSIHSSVESIKGLLVGDTLAEPNANSRGADSTMAALVLGSGELHEALSGEDSSLVIIGTTDHNMHTSNEFLDGHVAYCDRKLNVGFLVTSEEYLKKLRDLVED